MDIDGALQVIAAASSSGDAGCCDIGGALQVLVAASFGDEAPAEAEAAGHGVGPGRFHSSLQRARHLVRWRRRPQKHDRR